MIIPLSAVSAAVALLAGQAQAARLTQVADFGDNPSKISMSIYVPDKLAAKPAIIVVPHPCGGSSADTFGRVAARLPAQADALGMVLIFPETRKNSGCWDVRSAASITHGSGGGDTAGIVSMVRYALDKYSGDPARVFVTGSSSGGMMTNLLVAAYPDVFAAGASFSGPPAGCWDGPMGGNALGGAQCPARGARFTPKQWGDIARSSYPGFEGRRPSMQVWHGTADAAVDYRNLADQLDQWSDVLGVSFTRNVTNDPERGYTKMVYGDGDRLVGYSAVGVGHMVPFHEVEVLKFFGLLT